MGLRLLDTVALAFLLSSFLLRCLLCSEILTVGQLHHEEDDSHHAAARNTVLEMALLLGKHDHYSAHSRTPSPKTLNPKAAAPKPEPKTRRAAEPWAR